MGPPSEDDGKTVVGNSSTVHRRASMGPPSEDDGKIFAAGAACAELASMGPPSEDDGKYARPSSRSPTSGFNGAAVRGRRKARGVLPESFDEEELQWGRRPRTTERRG